MSVPKTTEAFGQTWTRVWVEDECLRSDPTAEHLDDAWKRLFGEEFPGLKAADAVEDEGDAIVRRYGSRLTIYCHDGDSLWTLQAVQPEPDSPPPGWGKSLATKVTLHSSPELPAMRMSLRDYFAAQAIAAVITRMEHLGYPPKDPHAHAAATAYAVADAMLAERSRKP